MYKDGEKMVRVDRLIEILQALPPTHYVMVNEVGNLLVMAEGEDQWDDLGYIDLNHEAYEPFD